MNEPSSSVRRRARKGVSSLLAPRSIGLLGASAKPASPGLAMVQMAALDGYGGRVVPINPNYSEIEGLTCSPDLASLAEPVEHVVIALPNRALEAALDSVIAHGAKAATIFASCHVEGDATLAARLARRAREAGLALLGGNCMGFYNPAIGLRVASFPSPAGLEPGGIVWIAQSGSAFSALAHNDRRLRFSACISSGMELTTGCADFMDWALYQPNVRVIGLFLETVREPARFRAALERAAERAIPVVVLKVGRTPASAAMALSHTGALAGDDGAYQALFARHGVSLVDDLDEMAATLQFFDQPKRLGPGGLASVHDSGGERELLVDLASHAKVPFAAIADTTRERLAAGLDPGLAAENPLDAWGTGRDFVAVYRDCLQALVDDPASALGVFFTDPRDDYWYSAGIADAVAAVAGASPKPVVLASNYALAANGKLARRLAAHGVPLICGTKLALSAVRHAMAERDFRARRAIADHAPSCRPTRDWRQELGFRSEWREADGLALLADYGIPVPPHRSIAASDELEAAGQELGYPLVLKTAENHAHKSEVGGVVLALPDLAALRAAYGAMGALLGPRALLARMAQGGVELAFGAIDDPAFGPVVMVAAGGVLIELVARRVFALAPFGPIEATRLIGQLGLAPLLEGWRGRARSDPAALADALARFSRLAADLSGAYRAIDVNPVIAGPDGAVAVDALVIPGATLSSANGD